MGYQVVLVTNAGRRIEYAAKASHADAVALAQLQLRAFAISEVLVLDPHGVPVWQALRGPRGLARLQSTGIGPQTPGV